MGRKPNNQVEPRVTEEKGLHQAHRMEGKVRNIGIKPTRKKKSGGKNK